MDLVIYYNQAVKPNSEFSHTDVFKNVEFKSKTMVEIEFLYDGKSSGSRNRATFKLDKVAGYSIIGGE